MSRRIDNSMVIKRLKNGACVMRRVCKQCQKEFIGERNLCRQCCNQRRRLEGKFGAGYHRQYYRRKLSKLSFLHDKGSLSKKRTVSADRKAAFEKQHQRVRSEMAAIKKAGYDPDNDNIQTIETAGVQL